MVSHYFRIICLGVLFSNVAPASARAEVDAGQVLKAMSAAFANYGLGFTAKSASKTGADIVLSDAEFSTNTEKSKPSQLGELKLENVSEKDGGYLIGQIARPGGVEHVKDGSWQTSGFTATNITIPQAGSQGFILYETFAFGASTFKTDAGKDFIKIGEFSASMSPAELGQPMTFELKPVSFYLDTTLVPTEDKSAPEMLATFGLTEFKGKFYAKGSWDAKDGRIQMPDYAIEIENIGKLNFGFDATGYTPETVNALATLANKKDQKEKDTDKDNLAAIGLLQSMTLNAMSLRFDDASVTGKIFDEMSKKTGQTKEALIAQAKGMATIMLVLLEDAELVTSVSKAVSVYLDNPKNFEIKLAPKEPVPMPLLIGIAMSDPKGLIKQLNLQVLANQ